MHLEGLRLEQEPEAKSEPQPLRRNSVDSLAADQELMEIFERTYGKVERRAFQPVKNSYKAEQEQKREILPRKPQKEYLLVDGYNIIFAWEELAELARGSLDAARTRLMDILSNYQGYKKCICILVFDAYRVPRGQADIIQYHNIYVVYTKEAETADSYIERATYEISREHKVRVATSDAAEQMIVLGHGALRVAAAELYQEVQEVQQQIRERLRIQNKKQKNPALQQALLEKEGLK